MTEEKMSGRRRRPRGPRPDRRDPAEPIPGASGVADEERLITTTYRVAELTVRGYAPSRIVGMLSLGHGSAGHMRVKRHLTRAREQGLLILSPPSLTSLNDALAAKFPGVRFEVVDDEHFMGHDRYEWPVLQKSARVVAAEINAILRARKEGNVVVGIPGGDSLRLMAESLRYDTGDLREHAEQEGLNPCERLTFVALNAAGAAKQFQRSANFVTVTLAGIYGARQHFCVLGDMPEADRQEYDRTVRSLDLLVSSAGDVDGSFFGDWLKREGGLLPPGMVGDLAFIPLDTEGRPCPCREPVARRIAEVFRPRPTYEELLELAHRRRIILVLRSLSREPIARAILGRGLAHTCVLGASLAKKLINA